AHTQHLLLDNLLLPPPPPPSPLFPYTTLFRSIRRAGSQDPLPRSAEDLCNVGLALPGKQHGIRKLIEERMQECRCQLNVVYEIEDRKSTRLNSSHVKISYAVFCLKKKSILRIS